MKFLVDMPLSPGLAEWLIHQGHEAVHAMHINLEKAPDIEILEYARKEGHIVITADLDYPRLLALMKTQNPGIILFRGGNYSEQAARDRLEQALKMIPHDDLMYSIVVIDKSRIRRRQLPI